MKVTDLSFKIDRRDIKSRKGTSDKVRSTVVHDTSKKKTNKKDRRGSKQDLKRGIYEREILTTVRLTDSQKKVLTKIIAAPNDHMAISEISEGRNLIAARDILVDLGMIIVTEDSATITDKGMDVMRDEDLIDEMGELTERGASLAYDKEGQENVEPTADMSSELGNPGAPEMSESVGFIDYLSTS